MEGNRNGSLSYRPASESDLDEVFALVKAAIAVMDRQGIPQWDEVYPARGDLLRDIQAASLFVGETASAGDGGGRGGKRIAVIYVLNTECYEGYENAAWQCSDGFRVIHRLCVHPDFQHQGIARQTLSHIEQESAGLGATSLRLDTFSLNPYSLRLYEHAGYRKTGEAQWRKGLFYLMEKVLVN